MLGPNEDETALMAFYIGGLRPEIQHHFRGTMFTTLEGTLGHAKSVEQDLALTTTVPVVLLEGSAEQSISVMDDSEEEEAFETFRVPSTR